MKKAFLLIPFALTLLMLFPAGASAKTTEPCDTVYLYKSWRNMFAMKPDVYLPGPKLVNVTADTPYRIFIDIWNGNVLGGNLYINSSVAATLGDSIWLINAEYLKRNFTGDVKHLEGFAPLFFNEKCAYFMYVGYGDNLSVAEQLMGSIDDIDYNERFDYYYIDFEHLQVLKVTPAVLSTLLEDYHDLKMRYEGMKDYKKRYIIEEFFFRFIDCATQDVMHPYILDLMN